MGECGSVLTSLFFAKVSATYMPHCCRVQVEGQESDRSWTVIVEETRARAAMTRAAMTWKALPGVHRRVIFFTAGRQSE